MEEDDAGKQADAGCGNKAQRAQMATPTMQKTCDLADDEATFQHIHDIRKKLRTNPTCCLTSGLPSYSSFQCRAIQVEPDALVAGSHFSAVTRLQLPLNSCEHEVEFILYVLVRPQLSACLRLHKCRRKVRANHDSVGVH